MYIGRGEFIVYSGLQIYDEIPNDINKNNELVAKLFSFMLKELKSSKLEVLKEFDIPTESGGWLDKMDSIPGITIICKKKITEDK
jgi:hypothetical protein